MGRRLGGPRHELGDEGIAPLLLGLLEEQEEHALREALPSQLHIPVLSHAMLLRMLRQQSTALLVLAHELGGPTLCRELRTAELRAPILYLGATGRTDLEPAALEAGADDFLVRPVPPQRLVLRAKCLLRRRSASGIITSLRSGHLELDALARRATLHGRPLDLTATQLELLIHLLRHRDRVLPADELVRAVLPQPSGARENIRYHISNLRRALGEYGKYVKNVRALGYGWIGPP